MISDGAGPAWPGVRREQPWRDSAGSEGMSEVRSEEDEEREDPAPRGTTTQMAMGAIRDVVREGMGTSVFVRVSDSFKRALPH